MTKGIIFDLDGVLVSTDEYHYLSWVKLSADEGFSFFNREFNHKFRGVGRAQCVEIITAASGKLYSADQKKEIAERKNRYFIELLQEVTPAMLLPGSLETLQELKRRGLKTAVASNSRNARFIIKKTGIEPLLDAITDGYEIENSKPDPEVFLLAAQKIGLQPAECIVVEDAVAGIEAATRAGMKSLGVGTPNYLTNASMIVKNLGEISVDALLAL
jgi:beta-phosphoglucomutase